MKRFAVISLLLSLSILAATPSHAQQTRARQVGKSQRPAPSQTPPANESEEVDEGDIVRVNTTLVTVPVNVTDRNGRYVPTLRQQDFRIFEDGVEQQIAYFGSTDKPFTVALLLDTSDSTQFKLSDIQDAAIAFLDQLRPEDRVMIVTFDSDVKVLVEPTSDRARLRNVIRSTSSNTGTRLYRAVGLTINERLNKIEGRKAIVLFTDGIDSGALNRTGYDKNIRDAESSEVLVYPVQYETSMPLINNNRMEMKETGDAYLREIAQKTGARLFRADTPQNLRQAFAQIAEELRHQYSLGYYPRTTAQAGQRRQIRVSVKRPDLIVQARDSYISTKVVSRQ